MQADTKRPTDADLDRLLKNILKFLSAPVRRSTRSSGKNSEVSRILLKHFFLYARDAGVHTKTIRTWPCFKERLPDKHPDTTIPRAEISRLRKHLDAYFVHAADSESFRVTIPPARAGFYWLEFSETRLTPVQNKPLRDFWRPFLNQPVVRLIVGGKNSLWDCQPKDHCETRLVRGLSKRYRELPLRGTPKPVYFPAGLFAAHSILIKLFSKHHVGCELDASIAPLPATDSVIVVGDCPSLSLHPRFVSLPKCWGEERHDLEIPSGIYADHFKQNTKHPTFRCYAQVFRIPIPGAKGRAALQIKAHHSIAVEAVIKFLTTNYQLVQIIERLKPLGGRGYPMGYDRDFIDDPEMAATAELGLLFGVTSRVIDPEGLLLKPHVPSVYLRIENTELLRVVQPSVPTLEFYNPELVPDI